MSSLKSNRGYSIAFDRDRRPLVGQFSTTDSSLETAEKWEYTLECDWGLRSWVLAHDISFSCDVWTRSWGRLVTEVVLPWLLVSSTFCVFCWSAEQIAHKSATSWVLRYFRQNWDVCWRFPLPLVWYDSLILNADASHSSRLKWQLRQIGYFRRDGRVI